MKAGSLTRRVTIQHYADGQNVIGQPMRAWVDLVTVWANIRVLNGREFLSGDGEQAQATASVRIRYREGITPAMRVVYRGQVYEIVAVLPDVSHREYVDLACKMVGFVSG